MMYDLRDFARAYASLLGERAIAEYDAVRTCLDAVRELKAFIADPSIDRERKIEALSASVRVRNETKHFFVLLAEHDALPKLDRVRSLIEEAVSEATGRKRARVASVVPLTRDEQRNVAAALRRISGAEIELMNDIDESLLGGFTVTVGDWRFDASLRSKIAIMNQELKA
jgi:F-type H+-transporting ATPase subunit delta